MRVLPDTVTLTNRDSKDTYLIAERRVRRISEKHQKVNSNKAATQSTPSM